MRRKAGQRIAEVAYVLTVALLAAAGTVLQQPQYYLAGVVLALPLGLAALAGIYGGYAVIQAVGGFFAAPTTSDGSQAPWLSAASSGLNIALLTAAAIGNVLLLRALVAARGERVGHPVNQSR